VTQARRRAAWLCAIATILFAALAWTESPASAQTADCAVSTSDQGVDVEEQNLLVLINQYRQNNGKNALAMEPSVTRAAAWFSRDMATKNYFPYDHVDSNGRGISQRLSWCGVGYSNWAENIYAGSPDAQSVFNAWKASSSHNTNMLREGITAAGIARAYGTGTTYGWYWTLDLTNTAAGATTTTRPPGTTTTIARPTTGPAPGTPEWFALNYPQYFGPTTTTRPATTSTTAPASTTTTTQPPATTTTTRPPATGPAPGTPEWWLRYYGQYFGR
jgi:uncharacterized protein YkwD